MVDFDVFVIAASIKDTTAVEAPSGGIAGDGERSFGSNMFHEDIKVVVGKSFVSTVISGCYLALSIIFAITSSSGVSGGIWVLFFTKKQQVRNVLFTNFILVLLGVIPTPNNPDTYVTIPNKWE